MVEKMKSISQKVSERLIRELRGLGFTAVAVNEYGKPVIPKLEKQLNSTLTLYQNDDMVEDEYVNEL